MCTIGNKIKSLNQTHELCNRTHQCDQRTIALIIIKINQKPAQQPAVQFFHYIAANHAALRNIQTQRHTRSQ